MRKLAVVLLVLVFHSAFSQVGRNVFSFPSDTVTKVTGRIDSLQNKFIYRVDSTESHLTARLDSIKGIYTSRMDSVQQVYAHTTNTVQSFSSRIQQKIDSLTHLKLPTEKYTKKLDSLSQSFMAYQQRITSKVNSIKEQATSKIKSIPLPPELESKVAELTGSIDKFSLPTLNTKLTIPSNVDVSKLNTSLPNLPGGNLMKDVSGLTKMPDVSGLSSEVGQITNVTQQAGEIEGQLKGVTENAGSIDQLIESKAGELDAVQELQKQSGGLPIQIPASEAEAKQQIVEQAQAAAIDHFAGKQEVLQKAMESMTKYKEKYESVQSIKDLPKHLGNAMRGRPLRERIIPGVAFQIQKKENFMIDLYGSVGYRLAGKITVGLGWNQRWAYNFKEDQFKSDARIYGPRAYGEFRLKKGFVVRGETECMNAFIPQSFSTTQQDIGHREWVWGIATGLKKEYKFFRNVKGNIQVMYTLYNPNDKSPYVDRLNMRMGFEFMLPKEKVLHK